MMRLSANRKSRGAYTLLELMIALGLLGALMSVAWSLMSTFRDAEQRGWKITRRTQIIRAARTWLQSDTLQMSGLQPELFFSGNSLGFTTIITPSLDPLPFLQRLMSDATSDPATDELSDQTTPWNHQLLEIEYALVVIDEGTASSGVSDRPIDDMQFTLVRREVIGETAPTGRYSAEGQVVDMDDPLTASLASPASERVLTGQDLYRQTDELARPRGVPISQMRLEGLVRPQFQYCDGRSWKSQWNSRTDGGLPAAIAFRFDFPARAEIRQPTPRRAAAAEGADFEAGQGVPTGNLGGLSAADLALASEVQVELETDGEAGLMESGEFEVQLVVAVAGSTGTLPHSNSATSLSVDYDSAGYDTVDNPQLAPAPGVRPSFSSGLGGGD